MALSTRLEISRSIRRASPETVAGASVRPISTLRAAATPSREPSTSPATEARSKRFGAVDPALALREGEERLDELLLLL